MSQYPIVNCLPSAKMLNAFDAKLIKGLPQYT
jgi:hypothetical protein